MRQAVCCAVALLLGAACTERAAPPLGGNAGSGVGGATAGGAAGTGGSAGAGGAGGGQAGAAGAGGTAGSGREPLWPEPAPLPEALAWLGGSEGWVAAPIRSASERCLVDLAQLGERRLPPLEWKACGTGCAAAAVVQGIGAFAAMPALGTSTVEGSERAFLAFGHAAVETADGAATISRFVDLASGETVAAWRQVSVDGFRGADGCVSATAFDSGLQVQHLLASPTRIAQASWLPAERRWIWLEPFRETGSVDKLCRPTFLETTGQVFYDCDTALLGTLTIGSSEVSPLAQPEGRAYVGGAAAGQGLVAWSEVQVEPAVSHVRAWAPDGKGVRTLVASMPGDVCAVGVGAASVAGLVDEPGDGPSCYGTGTSARVWIADRAGGAPRTGPALGIEGLRAERITTSGPYVALLFARNGDMLPSGRSRHRIALVRTTDWATKWIDAPDDVQLHRITLAGPHLYVVQTPADVRFTRFDEVRRYDVETLLPPAK